ncbi:MAG TPA: methylated-DNA--[protein]-cysteine S-methyltransferase [Bryobacteraceae bacterium]|nr:methylated-DNA--[protein]-cysteine S-methyltransferase [Bryobacteraceae bacterium]
MNYCYFDCPVGVLLIAGSPGAIQSISFPERGGPRLPGTDWVESNGGALGEAARQLGEYFGGVRTDFELRLEPRGTDFQRRVWGRLREIPYGETISYGELARRVGNSKAARAVGAANGANPIPIVVPCHRVIGAKGALTGFGGGISVKQALLALEAAGRGVLRLPLAVGTKSVGA